LSKNRGKSRREREENASAHKKILRERQRCSICPPNKGENAKRKAKHGNKKPKYKNINRHKPEGCPPNCPGCLHEDR
jgi:hypothetical protein